MEKIVLGDEDFIVEIWSRGAAINDIRIPDRHGVMGSVVLGYGTEEARLAGKGYLGEIVGPFANRIAAGGFEIDGKHYTPELNNNGTSTLHGGPHGFSYQDWEVVEADNNHVRLQLDWSDPTGGFPGPIHVEVVYFIQPHHEMKLLGHIVTANSPQPSVLSIVSHPYFNLSSTGAPVNDHLLMVRATAYLPVDEALIPLPTAPTSVEGTAFDFSQPRHLGDALGGGDSQVELHQGIDHGFVIDRSDTFGDHGGIIAALSHRESGRKMVIASDYPVLQVYTGQGLNDDGVIHPPGAGGPFSGVALETEEYPNAPRRPDFPSTICRPGEVFTRSTCWSFLVDSDHEKG
ncbi:MAG: galactose mutarotase [Propionibacteriaceae bacterium]|nr:galactose mutarotase [Propionibacteriaceae bacterium]